MRRLQEIVADIVAEPRKYDDDCVIVAESEAIALHCLITKRQPIQSDKDDDHVDSVDERLRATTA